MKKIAIVTYSLMIGGVESVIFNLGKSFISLGFDIEIIETLKEGEWKPYFLENNFKVVSITKKPLKTGIRHANQIGDYLKKFDIILLNDSPIAQSVIGKLPSEILIFPILHMSLKSMAYSAAGNIGQWNKIIAVSPRLKSYILKEINLLNESDVVVISNGIDTRKDTSVKKTHTTKKKIIYIGRLAEEKGVLLLPEIILKLKDNSLFEKLDIFGSGPMEKALKEKLDDLNLNDKIFLRGTISHEQVSEVFGNYDILILPSYTEGHPIVLLEAMACGLIPIVSRLEGSTDIVVENNINGYLCEPGNTDQFATALQFAIKSDSLPAMSVEARRTIEDKYSIGNMVESYLNLFNSSELSPCIRNNRLDKNLLGDLPYLPYLLVRPVRKTLRMLGLWTKN
jgi:glycosyltransferase involved in cell wall biosynthesis